MKRICFGSLYVLMYQTRGQGVKNEPLFDAILKSFRLNGTYRESLAGNLKNGHDKVPTDIIDAVRSCNPDDALKLFEINVMPLIKDSLRKPLLLAILKILDKDQSIDITLPISWNGKYTKQAVMIAQSIGLTYLLVSLIRFAVLEIDNQACADGIREIPDEYVDSFIKVEKDRIAEYEVLDEHFHVPYADRFQEGEFRKRIQFMFGGELRTIQFLYKGLSIEAVLDRFPTAEVLQHDDKGWLIKAEVYGDGVDIWLRGQGDLIEVVK